MKLLIALPAAGASSRMEGRDKLLEPVDDLPLLRRQVAAAGATGHDVLVTLRLEDEARAAALDGLDLVIARIPDATIGISASLRAIARAAAGYDGMAILLPDVPGVTTPDIARVLNAYDGTRPVRATDPKGRPGTPVVFPPGYYEMIGRLDGDDGARSLLKDVKVGKIVFGDDRATRDLDTPAEWLNWRNEITNND